MICFCADEFHWRRIWQNPGEFLLSGPADMAIRALLYRRPAEPRPRGPNQARRTSTRFSCGGIAARAATRCAFIPAREAILTMPPRGNLPKPRISRSVMAAGSPRVSAFAESCAVLTRYIGAIARCSAQDRASRGHARHRVDGNAATAATDSLRRRRRRIIDRRVHDYLKREARNDLTEAAHRYADVLGVKVKRIDPRPVEPLGILHLGRRAVVLVAADPRAARRARLSRRPRGGASGRDESFGAVLAGGCADLPGDVERAKSWLDTHGNDLHRYGASEEDRDRRACP